MSLIDYEGKKVKITDSEKQIWEGKATDYVYPEDNEPEIESLIIRCEVGKFPGRFVEFTPDEIRSIEVID